MIAYYNVVWSVSGVVRICHTHSAVAAEELLELLSQQKATCDDIDFVRVDAVPEEVYF